MSETDMNLGSIIYAREDILNDGTHPEMDEQAVLAAAGSRGVLVNTGEIFDEENQTSHALLLVRFEDSNLELGPPIGCWPQEVMSLEEWESQQAH